jgi:hypothetical protein
VARSILTRRVVQRRRGHLRSLGFLCSMVSFYSSRLLVGGDVSGGVEGYSNLDFSVEEIGFLARFTGF